MREHVVAASKAMKKGDWKQCRDYILAVKVNFSQCFLVKYHSSEPKNYFFSSFLNEKCFFSINKRFRLFGLPLGT